MRDPDKPDFDSDLPDPASAARGEAGLACGQCSLPIGEQYYTAGDLVLCERCRGLTQEAWAQSTGAGRMVRALGLGAGAAVLGAALWTAVVQLTGYELGLIAIVVGLLVGGAVRMGTRGRGGHIYQVMAVGLTYLAIVASYVPYVIQGLEQAVAAEQAVHEAGTEAVAPAEQGTLAGAGEEAAREAVPAPAVAQPDRAPTALEWVAYAAIVLAIAASAPFLAGFENAIGILIIGIALWQAWKMNARAELELAGPFRVGSSD